MSDIDKQLLKRYNRILQQESKVLEKRDQVSKVIIYTIAYNTYYIHTYVTILIYFLKVHFPLLYHGIS